MSPSKLISVSDQWNALKMDRLRNVGNTKGRFLTASFRLTALSHALALKIPVLKPFSALIKAAYSILINWVMSVDLHWSTEIGPGLQVWHGQGLIVHRDTIIGRNVVLRHNTTVGKVSEEQNAPMLGDSVDVGANCVIIGAVVIGSGARIGAGAVVVTDLPAGCVAVGNPARVIRLNNEVLDNSV